jgi:hypothetical protein
MDSTYLAAAEALFAAKSAQVSLLSGTHFMKPE